jgi:hypothetical protein
LLTSHVASTPFFKKQEKRKAHIWMGVQWIGREWCCGRKEGNSKVTTISWKALCMRAYISVYLPVLCIFPGFSQSKILRKRL